MSVSMSVYLSADLSVCLSMSLYQLDCLFTLCFSSSQKRRAKTKCNPCAFCLWNIFHLFLFHLTLTGSGTLHMMSAPPQNPPIQILISNKKNPFFFFFSFLFFHNFFYNFSNKLFNMSKKPC